MTTAPMPTIVVSEPMDDPSLAFLDEHGIVRRVSQQELSEAIVDADALVVRTYTIVDEALLARARRLKVVKRASMALENIDVAACRRRGVEVVHTPEANTFAVVDYTIGMIVQLNRRFWPMTEALAPEQFHAVRKRTFGRFLCRATLGIVGAGRIGSRVGRAAVGLGMSVIYNDVLDIQLDYPAEAVDKPTLFANSDVVTIHVPLTDLTRHMIDSRSLALFKSGAQFINAARGQCVDYHALAEAIRGGRIAAAAIDCHDPEPPPADYPLFALDPERVILTPHIAARVPEASARMCAVVEDVVAVLEGRQPQFPAPEA